MDARTNGICASFSTLFRRLPDVQRDVPAKAGRMRASGGRPQQCRARQTAAIDQDSRFGTGRPWGFRQNIQKRQKFTSGIQGAERESRNNWRVTEDRAGHQPFRKMAVVVPEMINPGPYVDAHHSASYPVGGPFRVARVIHIRNRTRSAQACLGMRGALLADAAPAPARPGSSRTGIAPFWRAGMIAPVNRASYVQSAHYSLCWTGSLWFVAG